MAKPSDAGSGNWRGRGRASGLIKVFTLLVVLAVFRSAAQAQERIPLAPELPPASAVLRAAPDLAHGKPAPSRLLPPVARLRHGAVFPGPRTGFFALHEPSHIDDEDAAAGEEESADAEEDDESSGWFGAEIVFLVIGVNEKEDDGEMRGFNLAGGSRGGRSAGLGFLLESGRISAELQQIDVSEKVQIDGDYILVGGTFRYPIGEGGSGSLDFLIGDSNDKNVGSLTNIRFNIRVGVDGVSSGIYGGLSLGLLYINLTDEVDSYFGNINFQVGVVLGGQF